MSSSIASIVLRRSLRRAFSSSSSPISNLLHFSASAAASPLVPRVSIPRTLTKAHPLISSRFFASTAEEKIKRADESLISALKAEIECAEVSDGHEEEAAMLKDIPFEIIDNHGDQSIILKREFEDECIQVTVYMIPDEEEAGDEDDEDDTVDDNTMDSIQPTVSLAVTIDKKAFNTSLEFSCNLDSEGLVIESMSLKQSGASEDRAYEGPEFSDLDESMQKALKRHLTVRGIEGSLYDCLREYMMSKDDREYKGWLKNIKEFVEA